MAASTTLQTTNSVLYYIAIFYVSITPVSSCLFFLIASPEGLKNETMAHFGSLYSDLDVNSKLKTFQITVFLLRRAFIGISIAFCSNYYFVQLQMLLVSSLFCLCFLIIARPYETMKTNIVEMINEFLDICTIYLLHCFSFFIPNVETRYKIGWVYLGVVGLVFVINVAVML